MPEELETNLKREIKRNDVKYGQYSIIATVRNGEIVKTREIVEREDVYIKK